MLGEIVDREREGWMTKYEESLRTWEQEVMDWGGSIPLYMLSG